MTPLRRPTEPGVDPDAGPAEPADLVAAAVLAVPGVAGLHGGVLGEVGTYLPGRRVAGVRLRDDRAEVHLTVEMGAPLHDTVRLVREAVRGVVGGPVDVTVEDVVAPGTPA
ncbi:hypothetical protein [Nocardioides litoris]|uniref:hypothetical protein n=1 Tax=Nocardioides litoris TaxID=1926648 RepID=UPI001FE2E90A|nr:hypothetical protein [Nocardioides litoris]